MNEELEKILEILPEEEKRSFIEKVKQQAQSAAKKQEEERKKKEEERKKLEEERKNFKASGHWETEEDGGIKISIDVDAEDRKLIHFNINNGEEQFSFDKNAFFNFAELVSDAYSALKEEKKSTEIGDPWFDYVSSIAKNIANPTRFATPIKRGKIFHIR